MSSWLLLVGLLGLADSVQADSPSKYRQECAKTSKELKEDLPNSFTSVWCANDKRKDFGEMGHDVLHAMIVGAFYEKRRDRRLAAMNMLKQYKCKTKEKCMEFRQLLDWGIKSGHPARYSKSLARQANELRSKVIKKIEGMD